MIGRSRNAASKTTKSSTSSARKEPPTSTQDSLSLSMEKMRISQLEKKVKKKKAVSYAAERVIGNGSFGVVYQAKVVETKETVAIKKVLQDRRFKNRELQIMQKLSHPDVVALKHCFYSKGEKPDDVYLNLVMEFIPETLHRCVRNHTKAKKHVPMKLVKVYMYQLTRSLAYIHSLGVCHRDLKPQNVLFNPKSHKVSLCDFGSAKVLVAGQPNVAYICSRYYRAPELVWDATEYTTAIDIWSLGCVFGELLNGSPLFPGESGSDQLLQIIKILGSPTMEQVREMNPNGLGIKYPECRRKPLNKVFKSVDDPTCLDLVGKLLTYEPSMRYTAWDALAHPFFDELRETPTADSYPSRYPPLFNFTKSELRQMEERNIVDKCVPQHLRQTILGRD